MSKLFLKFQNGHTIPQLGYGTFMAAKEVVAQGLKKAIEVGYRHIDCAPVYNNESIIGETLQEIYKEGKIKREDLFITSKLRCGQMRPEVVEEQIKITLKDLQTDYLDLYLIHMPSPIEFVDGKARTIKCPLFKTWAAMEAVQRKGLAKSIGVSNYSTILINDLLSYAEIHPQVNQIERNPYWQNNEHINFCEKNQILIESYGTVGSHDAYSKQGDKIVLKDDVILGIAKKHGKTAAQVCIRWQIQQGKIVLTKSTTPERIAENFDVDSFVLDSDDMKKN